MVAGVFLKHATADRIGGGMLYAARHEMRRIPSAGETGHRRLACAREIALVRPNACARLLLHGDSSWVDGRHALVIVAGQPGGPITDAVAFHTDGEISGVQPHLVTDS